MKTCVTETSIHAYHSQNFSRLQSEVLQAVNELEESCIADVAAYLNLERSTVAARFNELKAFGALIFVEKRPSDRTGIRSEFYRVRKFAETLF